VADEKSKKTTEKVKCDNHPDRDGTTYTPGAAKVNLCDECAPAWFKND
jgi:hypothetical protein